MIELFSSCQKSKWEVFDSQLAAQASDYKYNGHIKQEPFNNPFAGIRNSVKRASNHWIALFVAATLQ